jgi:hypothetical protein
MIVWNSTLWREAEHMKATQLAKMSVGTGAAILALTVVPAAAASASPAVFVHCPSPGVQATGLVNAITTANGAGGGTINLASGCTYTLTTFNSIRANPAYNPSDPTSGPPTLGPNGLPIITTPITINGWNTTIARSAPSTKPFRFFEVDGPSGNLALRGLTLTGGFAPFGGAIFNDEGTASLNHIQVTGNTAGGGGGIASGIGPDHPNDIGPIGTLTLNSSQVNNNTASNGGSAGGILNRGGTLNLNFSDVNGNTASNGGGGIASGPGNGGVAGTSTLNLFFSQVNNNTSNGGPAAGAGGLSNGGKATINLSQVNDNSAPGAPGGGILNHGTMTINLSQVNGNSAGNAGPGVDGLGGGIANADYSAVGALNSGVLTVNLSQVSNNSASGMGGGIFEAGVNPADFSYTLPGGPLTINASLVTGNSSGVGGGIFAVAPSPVTVKLTLVAKNSLPQCVPSIPGAC